MLLSLLLAAFWTASPAFGAWLDTAPQKPSAQERSIGTCSDPTLTSVSSGSTVTLAGLSVSGTTSPICPYMTITLTSTLAGGYSNSWQVHATNGFGLAATYSWSAQNYANIFPGTYTITVQANTNQIASPNVLSTTVSSVTVIGTCPFAPQFSSSLTSLSTTDSANGGLGIPALSGYVVSGTMATPVYAPCNEITIFGQEGSATWTSGTSSIDSSGAWSVALTHAGSNDNGVTGQNYPVVAYNTAFSARGSPINMHSMLCPAPVIQSYITSSRNVGIVISGVNPGCATFTATFKSGSNVYTATTVASASASTVTVTSPQALSDGVYEVSVTSSIAGSNTSPAATGSFDLTFTCVAPSKLTITGISGNVIGTATPTFTGTAIYKNQNPACNTITISIDGFPVGTATVTSAGTFSYTVPQSNALSAGSHTWSAQAGTQGGVAYTTMSFTFNNTPCPAPTIEGYENSLAQYVSTNQPGPIIQGTYSTLCPTVTWSSALVQDGTVGTPFSLTNPIGTTAANAGTFSFFPTNWPTTGEGKYQFTVTSCDSRGSAYCSTATVQFYVWRNPCPAPTLTYPSGTINTYSPALEGSFADNTPADCVNLQIFSKSPSGAMTYGAIENVAGNDGLFGFPWPDAALSGPGQWQFWVTLSSNDYRQAGTSTTNTVTVQSPPAPCSTPTFVVADTATDAVISDGGALLTVAFDSRCPSLQVMSNGQVIQNVHATKTAFGYQYPISLSPPSAEGPVTYTVVSSSGSAAPASTTSKPWSISWWNYICAQPILTAPTASQIFDTTQPVIKGTLDPGSENDCTVLNVYFDGSSTASKGSGGITGSSFAFTPSVALSQAGHSVYAESTGSTGRPGYTYYVDPSWVSFSINAAKPTIIYPSNGATVNSVTPTINGTVPSAYSNQVIINISPASSKRSLVSTTVTASHGFFTFTVTTPLSAGSITIAVTFTDSSGLTYTITETVTIAPPPVTSPPSRKRHVCPSGFDTCDVHLRSGRRTKECVPNLMSNLEQCGSCDGPDCTLIDNTNIVSCVEGRCVVRSCSQAFHLRNNTCVYAFSMGGIGVKQVEALGPYLAHS